MRVRGHVCCGTGCCAHSRPSAQDSKHTHSHMCVCVCVLYKCAQVIGYMQSVCFVHWKPECIKHGGRTAATHRIASQCQGPKCGSSAFCLGRSVGRAGRPNRAPGLAWCATRTDPPPTPPHHRRSVLTSAARPLGLPLPRHARTHARARAHPLRPRELVVVGLARRVHLSGYLNWCPTMCGRVM